MGISISKYYSVQLPLLQPDSSVKLGFNDIAPM